MRVSTVRAVNRLAARWADALPSDGRDTVLSATGVWPLLAFLADGAAGPARDELEDALGLPADGAAEAARELLAGLAAIPGVASAVGLWARPDLELRAPWVAGLPDATLGRFTGDASADRKALDAWAAACTEGLIPAMPVTVDEETELVLASAQAVRTTWLRPFREGPTEAAHGPWAGRTLPFLHRTTSLLDRVGVAETTAGPLTVLKVLGATGVDVHLLLGTEEAGSADVLRAGLDVLGGGRPLVTGDRLPSGAPGPGLLVDTVRSTGRDPRLSVSTPAFSLAAEHDLLAHREVFGLTTATDRGRGHFPGIGEEPLAIGEGRQSATARFDAEGFAAASVTAFGAIGGAAPRTTYRVRRVALTIDRPFAFLAVHRTSRLVLTAGWVARA
ncbi:serpin family protein [Streptomyces sp. NPDC101158]|uniref:serpin family protein n=1 Tax=Streptomyces sp. NPDC101158 TaxID=3366117 RepID=UPI0037F787DB